MKKILLVSTSASDMNGHPIGLWLEELAAPYNICLSDQNFMLTLYQ